MPATVPYRIADEPIPGYRLAEFLGRGGFGEVWKAVGPGGIQIAIKLIRLDEVTGHKELRSLRLVKRLRHPNLVPIVAYWLKDEEGRILDDDAVAAIAGAPSAAETARWKVTPGGAPPQPLAAPAELIIAMGLGEFNLHQRLKQRQAEGAYGLPDDELFPHLLDAARGIDYLNRPMHDLGSGPVAIQHCDIKPQNMLVVGGALQLCDFGLASMLGDMRTTSAAAGTIAYAAPECFRDGKPSAWTDQYSLAVTYYELKSGSLPYDAGSVAQVSQAILKGQLNFARVSLPEQQVLKRATALDPRKRYKTATEMALALQQAAPASPASGVTTTLTTIAPKKLRWLAIAAGFAAIVLLGGLFVWQGRLGGLVYSLLNNKPQQRTSGPPPADSGPSSLNLPVEALSLQPGAGAPPDEAPSNDPVPPNSSDPPEHTQAPAPELTNSLDMKLVLIPAGDFTMGTNESAEELGKALGPLPERFDNSDEQPEHRVRIARPFYLGATEVTVGQFGKFVDAMQYKTDAERDPRGGWGYDPLAKASTQGPQYNWRNCGFEQSESSPVVNVSWNDAKAFCDWLSKQEGKTYRLPSEAEWEYACRAGTSTRFNDGDTVDDLRRAGNVLDLTALELLPGSKDEIALRDDWAFTAPVASLAVNKFGLFDVHGNVAEWSGDWYAKDLYQSSPGVDPSAPPLGEYRVIRGGSWIHPPVRCRSAYRGFDAPDFRSGYVGFRVAREVE